MLPFIIVYGAGTALTLTGLTIAQTVSKRNCIDRNVLRVAGLTGERKIERQKEVTDEWERKHLQPIIGQATFWPLFLVTKLVGVIINVSTGRPMWRTDGLLDNEAIVVEAEIAEAVVAKKIEVETKKRCKKEEQRRLRESV